ncbi:MAG: primosomal protein N' [Myxococcales bacterium]|nr:primosomal protein N' [Myxococcales bacterium]
MTASLFGTVDDEYAAVAVGRPVRGEFTYLVPPALKAQLLPGLRVKIPFGRSTVLGFYLGPAPAPSEDVKKKVKPITAVLEPAPALTPDVVELCRFAAQHYRYPLGEVLRATLPPGLTKLQEAKQARPDVVHTAVAAAGADPSTLQRAPAQQATLSYLLAVGGRANVDEVAHAIPGAREHLRSLVKKALVTIETEAVVHGVVDGMGSARPANLTPEQTTVVAELEVLLDAGGFAPVLLQGVTGSGKTEVYLRVVERALAGGHGALILVPEIALTPQLVGRFRSRFGPRVAVLHSALTDTERLRAWQQLRSGDVKVVVGVRSAIWAPVSDLRVIVVDEEHDPSFKQDEKLRYQARDLAVMRGSQTKCLVVLGSATPSLETLENARKGRYRLLKLTRRVDDRPMPTLQLVDLRLERPKTPENRDTEPPMLSAPLRLAMQETLDRGQQAILFLNRRGHATFLACEVCGQNLKCTECDVCLTYYQGRGRVQCNYCGRAHSLPKGCPECDGPLLQLGVGTERIEAEVAEAFPAARLGRLDRDAVTTNERLTDLLSSFARRELDILIGTQMVAKGHDFPGVTLVAVILADTALSLPDFRASERTFHLLTQVAGRAGRGADAGRVLVQAYNPDALPIAAMLKNDFEGFSDAELQRRKALQWPPTTRMASIRIECDSAELCARTAQHLATVASRAMPPSSHGVRLLGPAPAPISRIKGKTRWQLVVKGPSHVAMAGPLDAIERALAEVPHAVKVVIDVDPGAML